MTRLLLTRIPFFKEIIVSSFACDSCSWSNTEIQSAGRIQEQGVRYTLAVTSRQVSMGTSSSVPGSGAGPTPAPGRRGAALHLWPLTSWSCLSNKVFSVPF